MFHCLVNNCNERLREAQEAFVLQRPVYLPQQFSNVLLAFFDMLCYIQLVIPIRTKFDHLFKFVKRLRDASNQMLI